MLCMLPPVICQSVIAHLGSTVRGADRWTPGEQLPLDEPAKAPLQIETGHGASLQTLLYRWKQSTATPPIMKPAPSSERIPVQGVSGTCQRLGEVVLTLVEIVTLQKPEVL